MDIYIKPKRKIFISQRKLITINDIAQVEAPEEAAQSILSSGILNINADEKTNYIISVIDIIKVIKRVYPKAAINNVGETDIIVSFVPEKKSRNPIISVFLIVFVTLTLLMGSATAIMSFHTDAQIPKVFQNYYKIFFQKESEKPLIIDIPYSIGLASGIIIFFNHFLGKKVTEDPTPIEVEMTEYENEVNDTILDQLTEKKVEHTDEDI